MLPTRMTAAVLAFAAAGFVFGAQAVVAGESGSCPYEMKYLPGNYLVSMMECSWKR